MIVGEQRSNNFWEYDATSGLYDISRSSGSNAHQGVLETTTGPVKFSPEKTALIIVDMQNFFLHPSLRTHSTGIKAYNKLLDTAVPACQAAGIDIIFLNWGLTEYDLEHMPPASQRSFSREVAAAPGKKQLTPDNEANVLLYIGLGKDMGSFKSLSGGVPQTIEIGRMLMRNTWNTRLYGKLEDVWIQGRDVPELDQDPSEGAKRAKTFLVHKNRLSGMWGQTTPLEELLHSRGIVTLLFAGVNTDQCVQGTLTDAYSKGFDCILLTDVSGSMFPQYFTDAVVGLTEKLWGFVSDSDKLAKCVGQVTQ